VCIGVTDLSAEEDNLRRVVDPDQQHNERGGALIRVTTPTKALSA
jgi:hypothetical protein